MKFGEMLGFTNRLKEIMKISNVDLRDRRLANLMTDLERAFSIPMLRNAEYEKSNPFTIQLYRTVSNARTF